MTDKKQSYNIEALNGYQYDDKEWQQDLAEHVGINVPDEMLYTPEAPKFVAQEVRKINYAQKLEELGDHKKAQAMADTLYDEAMKGISKDIATHNRNKRKKK